MSKLRFEAALQRVLHALGDLADMMTLDEYARRLSIWLEARHRASAARPKHAVRAPALRDTVA